MATFSEELWGLGRAWRSREKRSSNLRKDHGTLKTQIKVSFTEEIDEKGKTKTESMVYNTWNQPTPMIDQGESTEQIVIESTKRKKTIKWQKVLSYFFNNLKYIKWPRFTNKEIRTSQLVKVQRLSNCKVLSHKWTFTLHSLPMTWGPLLKMGQKAFKRARDWGWWEQNRTRTFH